MAVKMKREVIGNMAVKSIRIYNIETVFTISKIENSWKNGPRNRPSLHII